jgi:hypothetical protein
MVAADVTFAGNATSAGTTSSKRLVRLFKLGRLGSLFRESFVF